MFTSEQIKAAHSKVKSGADFPAFIQNIKRLGVTRYETSVVDGHTEYYGVNNFKIASPRNYDDLQIAESPNSTQFSVNLKAHQQGKTDYPTFCSDCAKSGIAKWVVSTTAMTCTYFDRAGKEVLIEQIPATNP